MQKINFSGGEPFLPDRGRFVGELAKFCKQQLQLPSVSVVSNGSLIRETWFAEYGDDVFLFYAYMRPRKTKQYPGTLPL